MKKKTKKTKKTKKGIKNEEPKVKTLLRIPTTEQYAYIEVEFFGSADEALAEYRRLTSAITGGMGMDTRDFNHVLDQLVEKQSIEGDPGMVEKMNIEQQSILQAVKRSQARIKSKNN